MEGTTQETFETAFKVEHRGKWPPDFSAIASVGFDKVSISKNGAAVRKVHGTDLSGKPHSFTEIEVRRGSVLLRYSCSQQSDRGIRKMRATLVLLQVLRLVPNMHADLQEFCSGVLPPFETALQVSDEPYEHISKKCADLRADCSELSAKNSRLSASSEENAHAALELEKQVAALQARIKKLEAVPDSALRDLIMDWVSSHRGSFSLPQFSKVHSIPPSRCEEGLESLLKEGAIRRIGGGFTRQKPEERVFEAKNTSIFGKIRARFSRKG